MKFVLWKVWGYTVFSSHNYYSSFRAATIALTHAQYIRTYTDTSTHVLRVYVQCAAHCGYYWRAALIYCAKVLEIHVLPNIYPPMNCLISFEHVHTHKG